MLTFVTVLRSGGVYSPVWVERLVRQAREHLKPDRIVCLTDCGAFTWTCATLPLRHNWPGWWSKIEAFRPGLFDGPCVMMDLDTAIVGPIKGERTIEQLLYLMSGDEESFLMLDDFYAPERPASGVVAWLPNNTTLRIYEHFARDPVAGMSTRHGDGGWIGRFPHQRLQVWFPGVFGSLKAHKLTAGPLGFSVVCQHGKPKFPDLPPSHWMRRHWER